MQPAEAAVAHAHDAVARPGLACDLPDEPVDRIGDAHALAQAGQRGLRVLLVDHAERIAEKIRISGGGRCNFTNRDIRPERFLSANPHFARSALAGYTLFEGVSPATVAATTAVAAGAILAMLADTMIPEAFDEAHDFAGLITVTGFLAAFALSKLGG